jgi:hypothetical protein
LARPRNKLQILFQTKETKAKLELKFKSST